MKSKASKKRIIDNDETFDLTEVDEFFRADEVENFNNISDSEDDDDDITEKSIINSYSKDINIFAKSSKRKFSKQ